MTDWNKLNTDAKLEALRVDIQTIFDAVGRLTRRVDEISNTTSANFQKLADHVDAVEAKLSAASASNHPRGQASP